MPKYLISFTEEDWYNITIEADSYEDAKEKFWQGDFDNDGVVYIGCEIQESIDIEEV